MKIPAIVLGLCMAGALAAQMSDIVTVKLPYAATVGKVTLPAGEYTMRDLKDDGSTSVISLQSFSGPGASVLVTHVSSPDNKPSGQTEVVLRHEGDKYQVEKIWLQGREYGYDLHPSTRHNQ